MLKKPIRERPLFMAGGGSANRGGAKIIVQGPCKKISFFLDIELCTRSLRGGGKILVQTFEGSPESATCVHSFYYKTCLFKGTSPGLNGVFLPVVKTHLSPLKY